MWMKITDLWNAIDERERKHITIDQIAILEDYNRKLMKLLYSHGAIVRLTKKGKIKFRLMSFELKDSFNAQHKVLIKKAKKKLKAAIN